MDNRGFTIKDLLIRLILIIIFIFLLIWLFPMPDLKPLNNQIFADNIDRMKDVAKSYYTVERLPEKINDYKKMTLKEMINNKLILPLTDSNGKYCSDDDSYIQITKLENEYVIKVYLSCTDKQDYVIEHFGCYDICSEKCKPLETTTTTKKDVTTLKKTTKKTTTTTNKLVTTTKVNKIYEYQFSKDVCTNNFDKYSCSKYAGYNLVGGKCIKNNSTVVTKAADKKEIDVTSTDTKDATAVVKNTEEKVNANVSTKDVTSTISATESKKTYDKVVSKVQTITADQIITTDVKAAIGTVSTVKADYIQTQNYDVITATKYATAYKWTYVSTRTSYNGNEAFSNDNEKLVLVDQWQELTCSNCFTTVTVYKYYRYKKEYTNFKYSCDAFPGYTLYDGNKCRKATTVTKTCPEGYKDTGSICEKKGETTYSCSSYGKDYVLDSGKKTCTKKTTTYKCPKGTTQNADKKTCNKNVYACPSGTAESSGKCYKTTYTCPANTSDKTYTFSGTKCIVKTKEKVYTCPAGTTKTSDEKVCVKKNSKTEYTCDGLTGYKLSGNKCVKTTTTKKTTYNCDKYGKDYTLVGTNCIKTENSSDIKNAEKLYKVTCNKEYTWTNKTSLDGWTYTGNKRLVN